MKHSEAVAVMVELIGAGCHRDRITIAHSTTIDGTNIAWVEVDGILAFDRNAPFIPIPDYLWHNRIATHLTSRYNGKQIDALWKRHRHDGPYKEAP